MFQEFRKSESSCLLLKDPRYDLQESKGGSEYATWLLSRSESKPHAEAIYASSLVYCVRDGKYALAFKDNLYKINKITLSLIGLHSYTVLVITFMILGGEDEQFLISDWSGKGKLFRGIAASSKEIRIYGVTDQGGKDYLSIDYDLSRENWTTLTCFWSNIKKTGQYIINKQEKSGTFHCQDVDPLFKLLEVYIGG